MLIQLMKNPGLYVIRLTTYMRSLKTNTLSKHVSKCNNLRRINLIIIHTLSLIFMQQKFRYYIKNAIQTQVIAAINYYNL